MSWRTMLPIMTMLAALASVAIGLWWVDRFQTARGITIAALVLFVIVTCIGSVIVAHDEEKTSKDMQDKLKQIGTDVGSIADSFLAMAKTKYPELPEADALRKLYNDVQTLQNKTQILEGEVKIAKRGVASSIDFNGTRRSTSPGVIGADFNTPESEVFKTFAQLEKEQKWSELLKTAKKHFSFNNGWFAPQVFAAVGYANLGDRASAKQLLVLVEKETYGNPSYVFVKDILEKL